MKLIAPIHWDDFQVSLCAPEIDRDGTVETRDSSSVFTFTSLVHPNSSSKCGVFAIISGAWRAFEQFSCISAA
jgi:hypothetical protein